MNVRPSCAAREADAAAVFGAASKVHSESGVTAPMTGEVLKTGSTQKFVAAAPVAGNPLAPYL